MVKSMLEIIINYASIWKQKESNANAVQIIVWIFKQEEEMKAIWEWNNIGTCKAVILKLSSTVLRLRVVKVVKQPVVREPSGENAAWWESRVVRAPNGEAVGGESAVVRTPMVRQPVTVLMYSIYLTLLINEMK